MIINGPALIKFSINYAIARKSQFMHRCLLLARSSTNMMHAGWLSTTCIRSIMHHYMCA